MMTTSRLTGEGWSDTKKKAWDDAGKCSPTTARLTSAACARTCRLLRRGRASRRAFRSHRFAGCGSPLGCRFSGGRRMSLSRQRRARGGGTAFMFQRLPRGSRPSLRNVVIAALSGTVRTCRTLPRPLRNGSFLGRRQVDAGPSSLRQADRDGLLAGTRTVLALADVLHLLAYEFPSLRRRCLALLPVPTRPFECSFLRHERYSSGLVHLSPSQYSCRSARFLLREDTVSSKRKRRKTAKNFHINRGGKGLTAERRGVLNHAKDELRIAFHRTPQSRRA